MQRDDGQAGIVFGGQSLLQIRAADFRFKAEILRGKIKVQVSRDVSAEDARVEIGYIQRALICPIAAA